MKKHIQLVTATLLLAVAVQAEEPGGWISLFDGKTLDGWERHGGKATYRVDDDVIVGASAPNTPNTFLCTKSEYGDFILEYEYFPHPTLNCGVQFRSRIRPQGDVVWGYQCEIDPSPRKWSAGIYEEGGRGWLFPVEAPAAQAAYKPGEWNKVRIVCLGPSIRTWLNDVPVADLVDDGARSGIIGLQVHGVGGDRTPMEIKWRNIRLRPLDAADTAAVLDGPGADTLGLPPPRGADALLAPGRGLEAWTLRPIKMPWMDKYEEGRLQWSADPATGVAVPLPFAGSMDSKKNYGAKRIHVEFRTPPAAPDVAPEAAGNSGVFMQGRYELQICNSAGIAPAKNLCGALYGQRAPDVNAARAPGEWQTYDIYFTPARYDGENRKTANARLSAKLNGQWIHREVEAQGTTGTGDPEKPAPGPLRLQEHQHRVEFRNVWVCDLDSPAVLKSHDPRKK